MINALKTNLSNSLRHYFTRAQWTTVGEIPTVLSVTPELDQPLQVSTASQLSAFQSLTLIQGLKDYISYLRKTLSSGQSRHIIRQVMITLQDLIWQELLIKQDFTTLGAARLSQDLNAVEQLALDTADICMPRLRQGVSLLNLPIVQEDSTIVGLMEASSAVYATNAQADEVLKKLGLDEITRADARAILARRVEASE
jgi:hypothetical protein